MVLEKKDFLIIYRQYGQSLIDIVTSVSNCV